MSTAQLGRFRSQNTPYALLRQITEIAKRGGNAWVGMPHVVPTDASARSLLREFEDSCAARREKNDMYAASIRNMPEQASKIALITAVSDDARCPVIYERHVAWSIALINRCAKSVRPEPDRTPVSGRKRSRSEREKRRN